MNLKQFKYVLTIAEAGSISKAADELNISQPSLSQYVKKIETQLAVELFDRTNGNCRLTDAGNTVIIIEHNLDVIKIADHIIDLGPEGGNAGGQIVFIGTPEEVAEYDGSYTGKFLKPLLIRDKEPE